jgi:hypothetical protein
MPRYYGVKCKTCGTNIPLVAREPGEGRNTAVYSVPLESIPCLECGAWHIYSLEDSLEFDGPEGLLPPGPE